MGSENVNFVVPRAIKIRIESRLTAAERRIDELEAQEEKTVFQGAIQIRYLCGVREGCRSSSSSHVLNFTVVISVTMVVELQQSAEQQQIPNIIPSSTNHRQTAGSTKTSA
jgi:hypothetical protein